MMTCRRCSESIGDGQIAHLVRSPLLVQKYRRADDLDLMIMVCGGCLEPGELGCVDIEAVGEPATPQPEPVSVVHLTAGQAKFLDLIARDEGLVWRIPNRIMKRDPFTGKVSRATDMAYSLLKVKAFMWDIVPEDQRLPGGVNAWAKITFEGKEMLEEAKAAAARGKT